MLQLFIAQQEEWSALDRYANLASIAAIYECGKVGSITTAKALGTSVLTDGFNSSPRIPRQAFEATTPTAEHHLVSTFLNSV